MTDVEFLTELWPGWSDAATYRFLVGSEHVVVNWTYRNLDCTVSFSTAYAGVDWVDIMWGLNHAQIRADDSLPASYQPRFWDQAQVEAFIARRIDRAHTPMEPWTDGVDGLLECKP